MCPAQKVCIYYRSQISGGDNHPGCSNSSSARTTNNLLIRIRRQNYQKHGGNVPKNHDSCSRSEYKIDVHPIRMIASSTTRCKHCGNYSLKTAFITTTDMDALFRSRCQNRLKPVTEPHKKQNKQTQQTNKSEDFHPPLTANKNTINSKNRSTTTRGREAEWKEVE